ncbi:MAG: AsmA family protein, partial [Janthinobacterium lividum]
MNRRMRRRLATLGLAVAVPIGALILVLPRLDPETYKPRLVAAVADATGRTLTLGGPLRIRWSLWPTLSVTDARLANLPGGSRPDMARAERIEAQIALLPLLHHRLEIVRLTLTGPNILFEQVGDTPNWVFTPGM